MAHKMRTLTFFLTTLMVSVSCNQPRTSTSTRKVYKPTKSCEVDHFGFYEKATLQSHGIMKSGKYTTKFDLSQLDGHFILRHDERQTNIDDYTENVLTFGLYEPKPGMGLAESLTSDSLIPKPYAERPKVYISRGGFGFAQWALKTIQIQLPSASSHPNKPYSPAHATVTVFFDPEDDDRGTEDLAFEFPVYGAVEAGVHIDDAMEDFLKYLAYDPNPRGHPIFRDLKMLKPAIESEIDNFLEIYYDVGRRSSIFTAPCVYVSPEVLGALYKHLNVLVHGDEPDELPIDEYCDNPDD